MTMERKTGEIFEYNGEWYQCVKGSGCKSCCYYEKGQQCKAVYYAVGSCGTSRSDKIPVIFKKLEPIGDPYPLYNHIVQRYAGVKFPVALTEKRFINCNEINNTIDIEVKQQNTEDMEANEKTMPVPDGWEFDRIDDSGNIVLKEKKKELPNTWKECVKALDGVEYITDCAEVYKYNDEKININTDKNLLPCGLGKPILALCQLLVCRNAWWKQLGWKPDWDDKTAIKHCIQLSDNNHTDITQHASFSRILAFPTQDTAIRFRNTFRDLIEEAKELL